MKHAKKLTMQDSASFTIALVIMAGRYVVPENSLSDYIGASIRLRFNHKQQD